MRETLTDVTKSTGSGSEQKNSASRNGTLETQDDTLPEMEATREMQAAGTKRRVLLLVGAVILLALAVLFSTMILSSPSGDATATVRRGDIVSTVQTTGKLVATSSVDVAFRSAGQVARVVVKQGDRVEEGQVMAELDARDLQRQLNQALLQLDISNLHLEQAKQGPSQQDLAVAQANVDGALAQLDQVKAEASPQDITSAQALLTQAQAKLDAIKRGASPEDLAAAQATLDEAKANRDLVAAQGANATEQARILLDQAIAANPNMLDPSGTIEQARLNYDTAQKSEASHNNIAEAQVTQAQAGLDRLKAGASSDQVVEAEQAVVQAQANLDKVKSGPTSDQVKEAQSRVDAASAALDKLKAGPDEVELSLLQQQVNLSQLAVDGAKAALSDVQLIAPIAGTVLSISVTPGELVGGYQTVATIADTGTLRVRVDVDELDVGRVTAGQAVTVTLDAYPGVKLPGKIDEIAPGATQKQGSTVYQATVSFTPVEGVVPREGMAANVDITAERKDNVLLLPNRAFETIGNRQYVTLKANGTTSKVQVETGLSNNTDTEVLSGLQEGQVVVLGK